MTSVCRNQLTASAQGGVVSEPKQWQAGLLVRGRGKRWLKLVFELMGVQSKISQVRLLSTSKRQPTTRYSVILESASKWTTCSSRGQLLPLIVCSEGWWRWNWSDLKTQLPLALVNCTHEPWLRLVVRSSVELPKLEMGSFQQVRQVGSFGQAVIKSWQGMSMGDWRVGLLLQLPFQVP